MSTKYLKGQENVGHVQVPMGKSVILSDNLVSLGSNLCLCNWSRSRCNNEHLANSWKSTIHFWGEGINFRLSPVPGYWVWIREAHVNAKQVARPETLPIACQPSCQTVRGILDQPSHIHFHKSSRVSVQHGYFGKNARIS